MRAPAPPVARRVEAPSEGSEPSSTGTEAEPVSLRFDDISHAYGLVSVLSDLDLEVKKGEITCLLGPSGGGKSTLLRLAAGLEPLQSGRIEIDERQVAIPGRCVPPEERPVGMMFQDHALFPHMSVAENVAFGLDGWPRAQREAHVVTLLDMVGCRDLAGRLPHQLSGGQQQRVALIRSLAPGPSVMLMDEPYASVDISLRRALREAARHTLKSAQATTLMVTHDPSEAMEMADCIAVLDGGRIVQVDGPERLYHEPASATVAALFGEAHRLRATRTREGLQSDFGLIADCAPSSGTEDVYDVVVRPDGLLMDPDPEGEARIAEIRFLGEKWLAFLTPTSEDLVTVPLRISIDEPQSWHVNDRVALRRGRGGLFVFDASSGKRSLLEVPSGAKESA